MLPDNSLNDKSRNLRLLKLPNSSRIGPVSILFDRFNPICKIDAPPPGPVTTSTSPSKCDSSYNSKGMFR